MIVYRLPGPVDGGIGPHQRVLSIVADRPSLKMPLWAALSILQFESSALDPS